MNLALASNRRPAVARTQTEIAATTSSLDDVIAVVARRARELTDAGASVIELDDGSPHRAVSGAARVHHLAQHPSLSELCVAGNEVVHCTDANYDPRVDADTCRRVGAISLLCVPLHHDGLVVGVLEVSDPRPRAFAARDAETLRLLGDVVADHLGGREFGRGPLGARPATAAETRAAAA